MVREVVSFLGGRRLIVDMTLGAGGHAEALLDAGTQRLVGVDRDPVALTLAKKRLTRFGDRFRAVQSTFSELPEEAIGGRPDGVLYDLGVSSMQLDDASRGFSYRDDGPLDMRMGPDGPSALELVNEAPEEEISRVLWDFGEERHARNIARSIVRARQRAAITTTDELTGVVASAVGRRKGGPHPARRTFQALRIAVNRELEELTVSLPRTVQLLAPGGRVLVLSYHSLEDRIVKRFFREEPRLRVLTKKVVKASEDEIEANPRARSAVLRAAERLPDDEVAA
jgi:16S rRNA (cytosine1402-N4)-methyltransferase